MKFVNMKFFFFVSTFLVLTVFADINATAQTPPQPDLSVAGFSIGGDEEKTKTLLQSYSPRYDNEAAQPQYFFYNENGDQVLSLTGYSKERPFLIVAIDVYAVGENYQKKHFQLKDTAAFVSESGFYIGERASAKSLILAIPNVTGPKEVVKKKGAPSAEEKEGKVRTLRYNVGEVKELEDKESKLKEVNFGAYTAKYRFYKNRLSRYTISVATNASTKTRL